MKFFKDKRTRLRELRLRNCNKVLSFIESYIGKEVILFDYYHNTFKAVIESADLINNEVIVNYISTPSINDRAGRIILFSIDWDAYSNRNIKIKVEKYYGIKFELRAIIKAKGWKDREFMRIEEDM
jgi:hypothetical protein